MPAELVSPTRPWVRPVVFGPRVSGRPPGRDVATLLALPTAQGDWHCLAPALVPLAGAGLRVALLSLRGERDHGAVPPWTFDDLVDDVVEGVRLLEAERLALMGTSFGGAVALAVAQRRPDLVDRLVLNVTCARLDAHRTTVERLSRAPGPLRAPLFHAWAAARCLPELFALGVPRRRSAGGPGGPRRLVGGLRRLLGFARSHRTPAPTLLRRLEQMVRLDLGPGLREVRCPTLVLSGEAGLDRLVPLRCQRSLLELLPDVRHRIVPGTGHLGLLTRPEAVRGLVADFLLAGESGPEEDGDRGNAAPA